ncbi:MAG: hypothetical protein HYS74_02240 [Parcubacteria group bacterium]|nr:hypothetical protein [Parcubacteria group bacterium]
MPINTEVAKGPSETNLSLIRRFSKRLRSSNTLSKARSLKFFVREQSKQKKRTRALRRIEKRKTIMRLKKLGKM